MLSSNTITKLNPNSRPNKHMNPQPLRITQPIILRLHFHKHHLAPLRAPNQKIRDPPTPLLILLRQYLTDRRQRLAAKTLRDFNQLFQREGPVYADGAGLAWGVGIVDCADYLFGGAVCYFDEAVVYFGGAGEVEGVGVEVEGRGLEGGLEDVWDIGEENIVEKEAELCR